MEKHDVDFIEIRGARVHNLKNVDVNIPLRKMICFAGPSGSGKTSLAFHTLLTESKRRFINSFPNSMKFFTERPAAVDVDQIFPVLPVFGLPQINPVMGSRAVVSDVMRLTDSLLDGIRQEANKLDVPYQSLMKVWLTEKLREVNG
jgi:excinuclease ABC subunit A